jgi:hypothetical protein
MYIYIYMFYKHYYCHYYNLLLALLLFCLNIISIDNNNIKQPNMTTHI